MTGFLTFVAWVMGYSVLAGITGGLSLKYIIPRDALEYDKFWGAAFLGMGWPITVPFIIGILVCKKVSK